MLAVLPRRPRMTYWRRQVHRGVVGGGPDRSGPAIAPYKPRCLGELRLADLLRAGVITYAEFETERAALLDRL